MNETQNFGGCWCKDKDLFAYAYGPGFYTLGLWSLQEYDTDVSGKKSSSGHAFIQTGVFALGGVIYSPKDICLTDWNSLQGVNIQSSPFSESKDFSDSPGVELLMSWEKKLKALNRDCFLEKKKKPWGFPQEELHFPWRTLTHWLCRWGPRISGPCPIPALETPALGHGQFGDPEVMSEFCF